MTYLALLKVAIKLKDFNLIKLEIDVRRRKVL